MRPALVAGGPALALLALVGAAVGAAAAGEGDAPAPLLGLESLRLVDDAVAAATGPVAPTLVEATQPARKGPVPDALAGATQSVDGIVGPAAGAVGGVAHPALGVLSPAGQVAGATLVPPPDSGDDQTVAPGRSVARETTEPTLLTWALPAVLAPAGWLALRPGTAARAAGRAGRWMRRALHAASWLPAIGLFSRLKDDELARHPLRAQLLDRLQAAPGSNMQELQQTAGVAWGTVVYHLGRLERAGLVVSQRAGNARRFWLAADPEARQRAAASVLKSSTPRAIADAVRAHPGIHQGAVCSRLSLAAPTASKHLKRLAEAGLVRVEPRAKLRLYYPTPRLAALE